MKTAAQKVEELFHNKNVCELSEWEESFLDSVFEQLDSRGADSISEKQSDIIHNLYDRNEDSLE